MMEMKGKIVLGNLPKNKVCEIGFLGLVLAYENEYWIPYAFDDVRANWQEDELHIEFSGLDTETYANEYADLCNTEGINYQDLTPEMIQDHVNNRDEEGFNYFEVVFDSVCGEEGICKQLSLEINGRLCEINPEPVVIKRESYLL